MKTDMDLQFRYLSRHDIKVLDMIDNIDDTTQGIFVTEYNGALYWITSKDGFFEFNDGWTTTATGDFEKAQEMLEKFIKENK